MWDWIVSTEGFVPRAMCGPGWSPMLIAMQELSHLLIAISYVFIPLGALRMIQRYRRGLPVRSPTVSIVLFMAFVETCGFTHQSARLMFDVPVYHFDTLVLGFCAAVSFAAMIWFALPQDPIFELWPRRGEDSP